MARLFGLELPADIEIEVAKLVRQREPLSLAGVFGLPRSMMLMELSAFARPMPRVRATASLAFSDET